MSIVASSRILVNKDLMSKLAITTLLVLRCKFSISLTKEHVSVIVKGLVKKGGGEEQRTYSDFITVSSNRGDYWSERKIEFMYFRKTI